MKAFSKLIFPSILLLFAIAILVMGLQTEQNVWFMLGGFGLLLAGGLTFISSIINVSNTMRIALSVVLTLIVIGLAFADYRSIKKPIEFKNEKDRRYVHVIQRLKDIRTAELAFKAKYQKYTGSFDTLTMFLKDGKFDVIKAVGDVPDTMTLEEAVKAGIAKRDTIQVPVFDSLFGARHTDDRVHPFNLDSLPYVPFEKDARFELNAGIVTRSNVSVPVFEAADGKPFDKNDVKRVGSMTDPKTNGNWE